MILAWLGAVAIGLSLGLLGSGGSILTVPVLVYLVGEDPKRAITESLAIVGLIALVSALSCVQQRRIDGRAVLLFGLPGLLGTSLGTALGHALPAAVQLLIFAAVMLIAATRMFRPAPAGHAPPRPGWQVLLAGLGVGVLTGVVGVGGGFLILPALVLLLGLPMARAVGTSLVLIALNAALGFALHVRAAPGGLHWDLIALLGGIGVLGSLAGSRLSRQLSQNALRRSFAGFLVVLGTYILCTSAPGAFAQTRTPTVQVTSLRP
ncbi:hypothetical protein Dcar01_02671 [Deinococcus carri]|uniref:Probable membrane transporter protein n=1 Tax=Deinococcus carri TaxID=1211323 RepID=A0ABP9WCG6_9DEIO